MSTAVAVDPKQLVQQAIRKVSTIATLPEITVKIIKTVEDPRSSAAQLHQIVSHDPALATRILKVVNSAFYGLPGQIASIERAIVLLGLNAVKNIAVAASLGQLFRGVKLCEGFTAKDLWTHCVAVGVTARELSRQIKLPIADEAFLAGLIHDIGILVSLQTQPEQLQAVCNRARQGGKSFCEIERELTGMDHQMLGMGIAELWKFPRSCQLVAGFHHQPAHLADNHRTLVALVHVADIVCCQAGKGFNLTAQADAMDSHALAELQLPPDALEQARKNIDSWLQTAVNLFS
ncbi:MAG: HDOD domain-containing protein [Phycisphaerae bacterium]|nr:HDOD domain-containing protein [Phycisphaerae bacterium]MDW8262835.1 HDOD domain-containing protein [Phycisphaerales bacterium]